MKILMVASEANPLVKVGGLGDVVYSLSKALQVQQQDVAIVMPFYQTIKQQKQYPLMAVGRLDVFLSWRKHSVSLYKTTIDQITYFFVDIPYYFDRTGIYGYGDEHERWAAFVHAVRLMLPMINYQPDIVHIHDWPAGMLPVLIKELDRDNTFYKKMRFVLTIHSPAFQGEFEPFLIQDFYGLDASLYESGALRFRDQASTLKAAIVYSDSITTVSPSHAEELLSWDGSFGLHSVLYLYRDKFSGILNGIDTDEWHPITDSYLKTPIKENDITTTKQLNKDALCQLFNLDHPQYPLFGLVSRLTFQKGLPLILDNIDHFVAQGANFIFLGAGEASLEQRLKTYESKYPKAVRVILGYNNPVAHQIYAASDFFLMPSLFEPCGISQMIAMRYGTLPIVRETGGLKDTVKGSAVYGDHANGLSFLHNTGDSLGWAMSQAMDLYRTKTTLKQLQLNAYRTISTWEKSSQQYLALYQKLRQP